MLLSRLSPLLRCPRSSPSTLVPARSAWGPEHQPTPRGKHRPNKHKDPKFSKGRNYKVLRVQLPDHDFLRAMDRRETSPSEMRSYLRQVGMLAPGRQEWTERAPYISCTGAVLEEFVPPEGDGKASLMSKEGAKDQVSVVGKKGKSYLAVRRIRKFEDGFDPRTFAAEEAQEIYIEAHKALAAKDEDRLQELATEKAMPDMLHNMENKSVRWEFIKSLEPPRVVQVRTQSVFDKTNLFAQVTVRFNTQQTLAVFDRFGRLIHGGRDSARDVLEYVVFERHLANIYGRWRMHAKIVPEWAKDRTGGLRTHVIEQEEPPKEEDQEEEASSVKKSSEEATDEKEDEEAVYDRFGRKISKA